MAIAVTDPRCPEAVAFNLMLAMLAADGKDVKPKGHTNAATRDEILGAYKEAITVTRHT